MEIRSKWVILEERRQKALEELSQLSQLLNAMEDTPCELHCSFCGEFLETEADFAKHFAISRYNEMNNWLNLGECPLKILLGPVESMPKITIEEANAEVAGLIAQRDENE